MLGKYKHHVSNSSNTISCMLRAVYAQVESKLALVDI